MEKVQTYENVDYDKFAQADQLVRNAMQITTGSQTIRETIDELNQRVIENAAREKSNYRLVQQAVGAWWTLTGKDATTILGNMQRGIDQIIDETKKQQQGIVTDIKRAYSQEQRLKTELTNLRDRIGNFEYAIQVYEDQLDEIDSLLSGEDVELVALSPDYKELGHQNLRKERSGLKDRMMTADIELQGFYARATDVGGKIEQTQRTTRAYQAQYRQTLANRSAQLKQQIRSYSPDLIPIMQRQADIAQMEEDIEDRVNSRNRVAEVFFSELEQKIDLLLSPHQANYEQSTRSDSAAENINQALDDYAEESHVRGESQRTEAYAAFTRHLM